MDFQKFINEVFIRSALWQQKDKNHHNRFVLDKLWDEVACELNITKTTARYKWKALRDKFRTTLAAIPKSPSGNISNKSSWQYFDTLLFLRDQFTPRDSTGNLPKSEPVLLEDFQVDIEDVENSQLSSLNVESALSPQYSPTLSLDENLTPASSRPSSLTTNRSQNSKRQSKDALLELDSKKVQYLGGKKKKMAEEDDDMDFFKSLLPHIKDLTSSQKMNYRMKILEVTQSFLNPT